MSFENPMEGNKKKQEKPAKSPEDLGATAVLEMPDGFEDEAIRSRKKYDDDVFEIDLEESSDETKIENARRRVEESMSGATSPITKRLSQMTPEERIALAKEAKNASEQESKIILEDSQGETELEFDFDHIPDSSQPIQIESNKPTDLEKTTTLEQSPFSEKLNPDTEDLPGEIANEYKDLTSEQIESLTGELRQELVIIANQSESAKEIVEKQNAFILEHAQQLGFPENLAKRLIADGRRILPIAPLATQGGMSAVFESLNLNTDSDVLFGTNSESDLTQKAQTDILKVIYGANASESLLERFKQEAIAGGNLNVKEKRVVNVRDADFEEPLAGYFMILEKAEGNDLQQEIKDQKLSPKKAIAYGIEIAKALKSTHQEGIIHRDIKPANIYLHREVLNQSGDEQLKETVKLADFGLIKVGDEMLNTEGEVALEDLSISSPGTMVGSPLYMAPEVLTGHPATEESDIYSLGVTMYQLLTKRLPYIEMANFQELKSSAEEGKIIGLAELVKQAEYADIPFGLAQLIDEIIEADPVERPGIDEIIERLEQLENEKPEEEKVPEREAAQGGRIPVVKEEDIQPKSTGWLKSIFSRKK